MNKKGFTLVELLITIVIIGIITILSFPQLTNLIRNNKETKYEKYAESLERGAKLYIDSHEKDIWNENENDCYKVTYEQLQNDYLVKEYDKKTEIAMAYVKVTKTNNKYTYEVSIIIKKDNSIVYQKNPGLDTSSCIN